MFGVRRVVSPLGGAENLVETRQNSKPLSKSIQILTVIASWNEVQTLQISWKSRKGHV